MSRGGSAPVDVDALFAAAREAAGAYRPARAERLLRRVLTLLEHHESAHGLTQDRVRLSLANIRAERGHVTEGLELLDDLATRVDGTLAGLVAAQRGLVLMRAGRVADALVPLGTAVDALVDDPPERAGVLLNRAILHLMAGRHAVARSDLQACLDVAVQHRLPLTELQARHNLAYLSYLAGDLPGALAGMGEVVRIGVEGPTAALVLMDRARALIAAGLLEEADEDLQTAAAELAAAGQHQDRAEAELGRASIALTRGDGAGARALARSARRRFDRRGSSAWTLLARSVEQQAVLDGGAGGSRDRACGDEARRLASELRAAGLREEAALAALVAVRADLAAGLPGPPRAVPVPREASIRTRLEARRVRSLQAAARGDRTRDLAELRAGLRELHRHQASFGSLDLQAAAAVHGRVLAGRGLAVALEDGRPGRVLEWAERSRAVAARLLPVRPPPDPTAAAMLEDLRYVRIELRAAQLQGRDDPVLRARSAELERAVRSRAWYVPGSGETVEPARLGEVVSRLAARGDGTVLVAHLVAGAAVHALVVSGRGSRVVRVADAGPVVERLRTVRADLDALALRVPEVMREAVRRSLVRGLEQLAAALWAPLERWTGSGPVVLVPAGSLVAVPWGQLPGLAGRPVAVARSATAWVGEAVDAAPRGGGETFAGGPELDRSHEEARRSAAVWPDARLLLDGEATGGAVLEALGGDRIVHIAAHGVHEAQNPLFSAIRLADGPLFGHDLPRAGTMPWHVVLSACDLGLATERPGEELLGMTAALLHAGAGSVLASVAQVGDDAAAEVMPSYHRALRAGGTPSQALAAVTQGRLDVPFVVFGAGLQEPVAARGRPDG